MPCLQKYRSNKRFFHQFSEYSCYDTEEKKTFVQEFKTCANLSFQTQVYVEIWYSVVRIYENIEQLVEMINLVYVVRIIHKTL